MNYTHYEPSFENSVENVRASMSKIPFYILLAIISLNYNFQLSMAYHFKHTIHIHLVLYFIIVYMVYKAWGGVVVKALRY
jgi:hypothetical protein